MSSSAGTAEPRNQSAKAAAAIGLGAVLLLVLLFDQGGKSTSDAPVADSTSQTTPSASAAPAVSASAIPTTPSPASIAIEHNVATDNAHSPILIDIDQIIAQNPFASPTPADNDEQVSDEQIEALGLLTSTSESQLDTADSNVHTDDPEPIVQAVVTGSGRPAVLINDQMYFESDIVDQRWQIVAINSDEVLFRSTADQIQ